MKKILIKTLIGLVILSQSDLNAQKKDYIIKQENDTIYVDKIKLKYDKVKVKQDGQNHTYTFDKIKSFYISKKEEFYLKVKAPNSHLDGARKEIFMIRLTKKGKINLFEYSESGRGFSGGIETYQLNFINILNAKPERIGISKGLGIFKESLSNKAYEQLRAYLYDNRSVLNKLDVIYLSKHKNLIDKIIELINEYNASLKK